ncbi:triose-phosphate isomerase [Chlorobium phaeovibrioides]|uniref:Triosephosphate isomerase n=1 Tax=Chlorobium phaeovibrioides (strain DSM 265 / 1930) TaxID=290318 RepID=TPIS_CHLPM|nr:triose-phosphate isomerase [Chlorobium phaeovibrioides]A4SFM8.1 RecName: Full=Triosephosphate isomerase; Short=TIM; Short=TPI; AltName: Full=Triose-phosphate isomerase [Chlorobium phaeovibrioides DSM 265]RTY35326.1 triose-phosphate isomerase [Chlorobium phaeovibrioides]HCD36463.1 triose-phosphate isomerase [Chlorobium sp.]
MRRKIVVGNWKMNKTVAESTELASAVVAALGSDCSACEAGIAPTYPALDSVGRTIKGSEVLLVAQNCHYEDDGAFTGEVSTGMLNALGCSYVIIGHSERRQYFGETDATVNLRIKKVLAAGMKAILCVGETLEERESGAFEAVVSTQVTGGLQGVVDISDIVIAYEPVWAIGTGRTASSEQAQEVHKIIRNKVAELYGAPAADAVRIQYGGSVKPSNAAELFAMPDIDGGLIGGAALKAEDFAAIVKAAC